MLLETLGLGIHGKVPWVNTKYECRSLHGEAMNSIKAIIGLGNPGPNYENTRHNVGLDFLLAFASIYSMRWESNRNGISIAKWKIYEGQVIMAKLNSYMNHSGRSISNLTSEFRLAPKEILVLYDDMDLPLGSIRIRRRGSSGGHKGMESIITALSSEDFPRLRVGIGKPQIGGGEIQYVLGKFTTQEENILESVRKTVVHCLPSIIQEGLDAAMSRFNGSVAIEEA